MSYNIIFSWYNNVGYHWQERPPGIYKDDYLLELFTRYGDKQDTPPAPVLPDWCTGQLKVFL